MAAVALAAWLALALAAGAEPCVIISEVNADNPRLDTGEFVELYHTGGRRAALDGYTLVFYNGNGNVAYKVLDLRGHATDERGFFLVGSLDLLPRPAIPLPPNTVQNGPDAVALYHSAAARYGDRMNVTAVGLLDAVVYTARRGGGAQVLAETLTPGEDAFLEDEGVLEGDESMERCLLSEDRWGLRVASPSPGQRNLCTPPAAAAATINELRLGGGQDHGFVELAGAPDAGDLVLVLWDGRLDRVSLSLDLDLDRARNGLLAVHIDKNYMKGDQSGAVAVYSGRASDFPVLSPLSPVQPLDAFVFSGPGTRPSTNLTQTLVPGRQPYQLSSSLREGGFPLSRCGVASWTRDPGTFWEAPQTPGMPNNCPWPRICPHPAAAPGGPDSPPLPPWGNGDFLINELNSDSPGAAEDGEYVELWHPSGRRVSLQGVWLLLFGAQDRRPYREISLSGHFTTARGYFLLGSARLVPAPSLRLPPNTIHNGPDAVALYRSPSGPPSASQRGVPTRGLLDAVVYRQRGSDRGAQDLSRILTPGQLALLEDPAVLPGDESLSRCRGLHPADLSAFAVAPPTPLRENSCPRPPPPPEGVLLSEVASGLWTNHSQQGAFVELLGPPQTDLRGLVLVVLDQEGSGGVLALPLTGSIQAHGFYVVGNVSRADQAFPDGAAIPLRGAVLLCYDLFSVCRAAALNNSSLRDLLVFSHHQQLLSPLAATGGRQVVPAPRSVEDGPVSLSRCLCCEVRSPASWTSSSPTPHATNLCPSSAYSSQIDLCLGPLSKDWRDSSSDCSGQVDGRRDGQVDGQRDSGRDGWRDGQRDGQVADYLEQKCRCGISPLALRGTNVSCESGWLRVWGHVLALSRHQRTLIAQTWRRNGSSTEGGVCPPLTAGRYASTASVLGFHLGLVAVVLLLLFLVAALVSFFYRRRRPLDYSTMELNEHAEGLTDL